MIAQFAQFMCMACLGGICAQGAGLKLLDAPVQYLFSGAASTLEIMVSNRTTAVLDATFRGEVYQASSYTLAKLSQKPSSPLLPIPPSSAVRVSLPFTAPEVRVITRFVIKVFDGETPLGEVQAHVCPTNILSTVAKLVHHADVIEPEPLLWPLLALTSAERKKEPGLLIVRLHTPEQESAWKNASRSPEAPLLFIVSPGVTGHELLAPIKFLDAPAPRSALVQDWFVPDLAHNPLSQLRLLRVIELLTKPEIVKIP